MQLKAEGSLASVGNRRDQTLQSVYRPLHCAHNIDNMILLYRDGRDSCAARGQRKSILITPGDLYSATLDCGVERRLISTLHCGLSTVGQHGMMLDSRRSCRKDGAGRKAPPQGKTARFSLWPPRLSTHLKRKAPGESLEIGAKGPCLRASQ